MSGLLKLLLALEFANLPPRYDEAEFLDLGRRTATVGTTDLYRAPGYQAFVALGLSLAGGSPLGVRLLQVLVSIATCLVVYRTTRRLAGERAALVTGGFLAFYPSHVAFSHLIWAETLFLLPVVCAFDRLLDADERSEWRSAVLAGGLLGAASLVRSVGVILLACSCLWLWRGRGRLGLVATVAGAAALVILPWSIHASLRADRPVLIDGNGGVNLFSGNNPHIPSGLQGIWSLGLPLMNGVEGLRAAQLSRKGANPELGSLRPEGGWRAVAANEMVAAGIGDPQSFAAADHLRDIALQEISRNPMAAVARVPLKLSAWWSPDFFLPRHLLRDWYGAVPRLLALGLAALAVAASAVPLLLGPMALATLPRSRFRSLAAAWLAGAACLHAMAFGVSRMHQPFVPLLLMAVSLLLLAPGNRPDRRRGLRRGLPVLGLVLCAWIVSAPAVVGLYLSPGPRYAGLARWLGAVGETPLPAARHATWMRAQLVAATGDEGGAEQLLATSRHAQHPWTLLQRALVAEPDEMRPLAERAYATGPIAGFEREGMLRSLPEPLR